MLPLALPNNPVGDAVKHKMDAMYDSPVWLLKTVFRPTDVTIMIVRIATTQ